MNHLNKILFIVLLLLDTIRYSKNKEQSFTEYEQIWQSFPACKNGRLQSPIKLDIPNSNFKSTFSIVYESYNNVTLTDELNNYTFNTAYSLRIPKDKNFENAGFLNFERNGIIKQYKLLRFELYNGLHELNNNDKSLYELHIVYKKVLGFTSNKNQYMRIQDANNYLVIVMRYNEASDDKKINLISDNGLLHNLNNKGSFNLGDYPVFQDKKAYFYEGSFIYNPCNEDINYIVIEPVFKLDDSFNKLLYSEDQATKKIADSYDRPIYRNFMNYSESLSEHYIKFSFILRILIFLYIF